MLIFSEKYWKSRFWPHIFRVDACFTLYLRWCLRSHPRLCGINWGINLSPSNLGRCDPETCLCSALRVSGGAESGRWGSVFQLFALGHPWLPPLALAGMLHSWILLPPGEVSTWAAEIWGALVRSPRRRWEKRRRRSFGPDVLTHACTTKPHNDDIKRPQRLRRGVATPN